MTAPDAEAALRLIEGGSVASGQLSAIAAALDAAAARPEAPVHRRLAALGLPPLVKALVHPSDALREADAESMQRVLAGCARLIVAQLDMAARAASAATAPTCGVEAAGSSGPDGTPAVTASKGAQAALATPESEETLLILLSLLAQLLEERAPLWNPDGTPRGTPPPLRAFAAAVVGAGGTQAVLGTAGALSEAAALDTALTIIVRLSCAGAYAPGRAQTQAQVCEVACAAAAVAFGRLTGASVMLRSEERFSAATATLQSLALLLPSDIITTELPAASFRAMLPARLALLSAAAGKSPLLLVRLRAVKEAVGMVEQARVFGAQESIHRKLPMLKKMAAQLAVARLPAALLGPLAHETVLARAGPIFGLMREEGELDSPHLRALWRACACAPPPVSAGVAALVVELFSACKPDDALRDALLDAITLECATDASSTWVDGPQPRGVAPALETLAPTFSSAAPPVPARFALLLLRLIAAPSPRRPMPELRPCLVSHLRMGPLRSTALAAFCRPLQRACGLPVAPADAASGGYRGTAPRHRRSASDGTTLTIPKLDQKGGSPPLQGSAAEAWLPSTLAEAADALPTDIAMLLVLEVGVNEATRSSDGGTAPALLVQAEAKLGLVALAHALVCAPPESGGVAGAPAERRTRQRSRSLGGQIQMQERSPDASPGAPPARLRSPRAMGTVQSLLPQALLPASWAAEASEAGETGEESPGSGEEAWGGAAPAVGALCGRLSFYGSLCAQLRTPVSRPALDAAWEAMRGDAEKAALLLWLPSVLPQLTPEALDRAFLDYSLGSLRWSTLTLRQYAAFECLYRRYHVTKGGLRSVPADDPPIPTPSAAPGSGRFRPRLWRLRRTPAELTAELANLRAEALPSSLAGTEALWRLLLLAPEATGRSAMPLLVQLHLRPAPTLDLATVRHELLRGCTHVLRMLCGKASEADAPADASLRASLLLELITEFVTACGERRKLTPHRASWRGLTTRMTVHLPTRGGPVDAPALAEMLLPQAEEQAQPAREEPLDRDETSPLVHYAEGPTPDASAAPAAAPPPAAAVPPPATPRPGIVRRVATYLPAAAVGRAESTAPESERCPPEGVAIELACHENTTVGQLKQQLKRRMVALGYPKPSYRCMELLAPSRTLGETGMLEGWVPVRGEERTLAEAGLTPDGRLSLQLHSKPGPKADAPASLAHPAVLLAASAEYTPALFDAIRVFGHRAPAVAAQAWELLMRIPTAHHTLAQIRAPASVDWTRELASLHALPALYLLQAVRARLTPPDAPADSAWAAQFILHGLAPIFDAFVGAVDDVPPRDGGALLAALLSIVRVCLGGYLKGDKQVDSSDSGSPAKRPLPKLTDPLATPRHRGLATTQLHIVPAIALLPAVGEEARLDSPEAARMTADASRVPQSLRAPPPPGVQGAEAQHLWALAQVLLFLIDRAGSDDSAERLSSVSPGRGERTIGGQMRRGIILDALKLLDAIACAHPLLAAPLIGLEAMPLAMREALLATPDARTRRQACILLWGMCSVDPASLPPVLSFLESLIPAAATHAPHGAQYWDLWHRLLSTSRAAQGTPSCTDALCAVVVAHLAPPEPPKDTMSPGGTVGRMPPGGGAPSPVEAALVLGPLRLLSTQARASPQCADRLAPSLPLIYSACLIPTGHRQPPPPVRDAAAALLAAAAAGSPACVAALLPPIAAAHARGAAAHASALSAAGGRGGWGVDPASASRRDLVGLTNLGATCYMNALLQQLAMVPAFRDGLIAAAPPQRSAILDQMQVTLAHLRDGLAPCYDTTSLVSACEALPMTFSARQQNDAAEFLMLLMDHLEERLKGTKQALLVRSCFGGKLVQQIVWEELPALPGGIPTRQLSEREEPFLQIELPVKGHASITDALKAMVEGERLEGDNAYQLKNGVKVDATKRICIGELPATLIIQLKRFELDYESMSNQKLNSECAFPSKLDLEPFTRRGLECAAKGISMPPTPPYELTGVLVHAGTSASGHYLSYARPRDGPAAGRWYLMNDETVTQTQFDDEAIREECFGGMRELTPGGAADAKADAKALALTAERGQNAFMLFYRRPDSLHRRSGSAPPTGTRRERPAAPAAQAIASAAGGRTPGQSVSFGDDGAAPPADASAAAAAVVAANEALLLRQHLLSPTYANLMRELVRIADSSGDASATLPLDGARTAPSLALVQLGASFFFGHLLRTSGELLLPYLIGYDAWPRALARACAVHKPAAAWLLHAMVESRPYEEPHPSTAAVALPSDAGPPPVSERPPPCWLLDALFLCASPAAQDAVASFTTSLMLTVHAAEANTVRGTPPSATAVDEAGCVRTSDFLSALLTRGVDCAAAHWRHAAPLWALFSAVLRAGRAPAGAGNLAVSPDGSPTRHTLAGDGSVRLLASRLGALRVLAAYVIGAPAGGRRETESASQPTAAAAAPAGPLATWSLPEALVEIQARMPDRRTPQQVPAATATASPASGAAPAAGTSGAAPPAAAAPSPTAQGDGACALLESIALIVEAHMPPPPRLARPPPIANSLSPPSSPRRAAYGPPLAPVADADADALTCAAFVHAAVAMAVAPSTLAPAASPAISPLFDAAASSPRPVLPLDYLCRILRPLCASSLGRSLVVVGALVEGLRHEPSEALATAYAPLLLHLLRIEDEHTRARCAAALAMPHGILALLLESSTSATVSEEPVAPVAGGVAGRTGTGAGGGTASGSAEAAATTPAAAAAGRAGGGVTPTGLINDSARCFLSVRILLELHNTSEPAAAWVESILGTAEVDQITRWIKLSFTGQALGPALDATRDRRMLSFSRRRPAAVEAPERLVTPRAALESLRTLRKRVEKAPPQKLRV